METLDPEVLDSIQPFSGMQQPSTAMEVIAQGGSMQQIKTAYTTAVAVQKPRSITTVTKNVLQEAQLAGSSFYYRWEVKDKSGKKSAIEGPSIDLAMCIARNYGNCVIDVDAQETSSHYMMKGVLIDLETGFTCPRLFRQRKSQKLSGKMDDARQEDIAFQIGQSKAIRNAIVRAMPSWLIDQAIAMAQRSELSKIKPENLAVSRSMVLDFFSKFGVGQDRIEAERTRKADEWTAQDIVDLRGMATALKEGRISPDDLFPAIELKEEPKNEPEKTPEKQEVKKHAKDQPKEENPKVPLSDEAKRRNIIEQLESHGSETLKHAQTNLHFEVGRYPETLVLAEKLLAECGRIVGEMREPAPEKSRKDLLRDLQRQHPEEYERARKRFGYARVVMTDDAVEAMIKEISGLVDQGLNQ